jgi:hypothetical protein
MKSNQADDNVVADTMTPSTHSALPTRSKRLANRLLRNTQHTYAVPRMSDRRFLASAA